MPEQLVDRGAGTSGGLPNTTTTYAHAHLNIASTLSSYGFLTSPTTPSTLFPPTMDIEQQAAGSLSWRLSSHPITLLTFLSFRVGMLSFPSVGCHRSCCCAPHDERTRHARL